ISQRLRHLRSWSRFARMDFGVLPTSARSNPAPSPLIPSPFSSVPRSMLFENSEALERAERFNYRHSPCGLSFVLNGSASNYRGERVSAPAARANLHERFTMPESTLDTIVNAMVESQETPEQEEAPEQEAPEQEEEQAPEQDEKQLNALLRKAESAFT